MYTTVTAINRRADWTTYTLACGHSNRTGSREGIGGDYYTRVGHAQFCTHRDHDLPLTPGAPEQVCTVCGHVHYAYQADRTTCARCDAPYRDDPEPPEGPCSRCHHDPCDCDTIIEGDQAAIRRRIQAYHDGHHDGYAGFAPHAGWNPEREAPDTLAAYTAGYECGSRDRQHEAPGWTLDIECPDWTRYRAEEE